MFTSKQNNQCACAMLNTCPKIQVQHSTYLWQLIRHYACWQCICGCTCCSITNMQAHVLFEWRGNLSSNLNLRIAEMYHRKWLPQLLTCYLLPHYSGLIESLIENCACICVWNSIKWIYNRLNICQKILWWDTHKHWYIHHHCKEASPSTICMVAFGQAATCQGGRSWWCRCRSCRAWGLSRLHARTWQPPVPRWTAFLSTSHMHAYALQVYQLVNSHIFAILRTVSVTADWYGITASRHQTHTNKCIMQNLQHAHSECTLYWLAALTSFREWWTHHKFK